MQVVKMDALIFAYSSELSFSNLDDIDLQNLTQLIKNKIKRMELDEGLIYKYNSLSHPKLVDKDVKTSLFRIVSKHVIHMYYYNTFRFQQTNFFNFLILSIGSKLVNRHLNYFFYDT
ncbi:hypothetical protein AMTRI_Chr11g153880 [Amborella trichopoda]